mgnify:CR=1 FL=1
MVGTEIFMDARERLKTLASCLLWLVDILYLNKLNFPKIQHSYMQSFTALFKLWGLWTKTCSPKKNVGSFSRKEMMCFLNSAIGELIIDVLASYIYRNAALEQYLEAHKAGIVTIV